MRDSADADRIKALARELGRAVPAGTRMYLTGGATAVLDGWRDSTVGVDVRFEPDSDATLSRRCPSWSAVSNSIKKTSRAWSGRNWWLHRHLIRAGVTTPTIMVGVV